MRFKSGWCTKCNAERLIIKRRCQICHERVLGKSKYNNVPTRAADGKMKHSRKEAARLDVLLALYRAGKITNLQPDPDNPRARQQEFRLELYSTQAVEALLEYLAGENWSVMEIFSLTRDVQRSRQCVARYRSDYTYTIADTGEFVVEDPKGKVTDVYRMKKILMRLAHNIDIQEP
jgi:hypothetical protein